MKSGLKILKMKSLLISWLLLCGILVAQIRCDDGGYYDEEIEDKMKSMLHEVMKTGNLDFFRQALLCQFKAMQLIPQDYKRSLYEKRDSSDPIGELNKIDFDEILRHFIQWEKNQKKHHHKKHQNTEEKREEDIGWMGK